MHFKFFIETVAKVIWQKSSRLFKFLLCDLSCW